TLSSRVNAKAQFDVPKSIPTTVIYGLLLMQLHLGRSDHFLRALRAHGRFRQTNAFGSPAAMQDPPFERRLATNMTEEFELVRVIIFVERQRAALRVVGNRFDLEVIADHLRTSLMHHACGSANL